MAKREKLHPLVRLFRVVISSFPSLLLSLVVGASLSNTNKNCCCLAFVLQAPIRLNQRRVLGSNLRSRAAIQMGSNDDSISSSLENALRFARKDPDAVVLSLWPSAIGSSDGSTNCQIGAARSFLERSGATVLHESSVEVPHSAQTLLVMAAYWGEDWLRTNCWYGEQPLEELGLPHPTGSWPGAKWKKELCFRQTVEPGERTTRMHVFVADVSGGDNNNRRRRHRLWSEKYSVRAAMARDTGHAGNSCMHLTDDQSGIVGRNSGGGGKNLGGGAGMDCNASYAFACARCLLNPLAMEFLEECATNRFPRDDNLKSDEFLDTFGRFCKWLGDTDFEDVVEESGKDGSNDSVKRWNRPPI